MSFYIVLMRTNLKRNRLFKLGYFLYWLLYDVHLCFRKLIHIYMYVIFLWPFGANQRMTLFPLCFLLTPHPQKAEKWTFKHRRCLSKYENFIKINTNQKSIQYGLGESCKIVQFNVFFESEGRGEILHHWWLIEVHFVIPNFTSIGQTIVVPEEMKCSCLSVFSARVVSLICVAHRLINLNSKQWRYSCEQCNL